VGRVARLLGLHELIAEDIVEGNQRSKIEATDGLVHIVLFALDFGDEIRTHEIDLVLGDGYLLSSHPAAWDPRAGSHFRAGLGPIMKAGPDHVLWAVFDMIVDAYFPFADRVEDEIDAIQDQVIGRADRATLGRVFEMKRELIAVRRAVSPVREVLNQLTNRELALIDAEEIIYFRDIYDHVIRLTDELDNDRELVTATLDVYLSQVNNNLSAIMKRLTGVTVILAGIGAVAGIFGMSRPAALPARLGFRRSPDRRRRGWSPVLRKDRLDLAPARCAASRVVACASILGPMAAGRRPSRRPHARLARLALPPPGAGWSQHQPQTAGLATGTRRRGRPRRSTGIGRRPASWAWCPWGLRTFAATSAPSWPRPRRRDPAGAAGPR
jgi:magnesium/cobalt transport protein CorA